MDSVNTSRSGSMQSSTGCDHEIDQEYHVGPFSSSTTMFHPLSNYFHTSQTTPQPLPNKNLDIMWSEKAGSEPNQTDLTGLMPCSSPSLLLQNQINHYNNNNNASFQLAANCHTRDDQAQNNTCNNTNVQVGNRNPKKRSRASRRAPTTVLTTDTTNFRAMVQEFTGIPELPPFASSYHFPRTRLDLFTSASTTTSPAYNLLRPFAQKLNNQLHHPFPSSSSIHNKLSSSVDNLKQPLNNIFSMQNQNKAFSFQTFHPTPQKQKYEHPLGNSSVTVSKVASLETPPSIIDPPYLKMGNVFEELGTLRHDHVNLSSNNNHVSREWVQRTHGSITNNDCDDSALASSSDFHGEKEPECSTLATRNEGNVEPWIN